jgi:hypothetical protein
MPTRKDQSMTEYSAPPTTSDPPPQTPTDQARAVVHSAADAGGDVVDTAKEQGKAVVAETGRQARDLYATVRSEVNQQASTQQRRAVGGLYALGDEVGRMADHGGESSATTQVARQVSNRITQTARWLESREPGDLLAEVKAYARQHPGTFLLGAAALGVLAGRLTRNLATSTDEPSTREPFTPATPAGPPVPATPTAATPPVTPASPVTPAQPYSYERQTPMTAGAWQQSGGTDPVAPYPAESTRS